MCDRAKAMKVLWSEEEPEYHGPFVDFDPVWSYPKPVQQLGPPIYFGGESKPALRRTADLGHGWYGFNTSVQETRDCLVSLDEMLEKRGRQRSDLAIVIGPYRHKLPKDTAKEYEDAGVNTLVVMVVGRDLDEMYRWLDRFADDYVT